MNAQPQQQALSIVGDDQPGYLVLASDVAELQEVIRENLAGQQLTPGDLDRVKVPAGGATIWTVPTVEGEIETKELTGIIVYHKRQRLYWAADFTGENTPPDCYAPDGEWGIGNPGGECAKCALAEWGSSPKGKGQACKQTQLLFLVREGDILPIVLNVPPTSLQNVKTYFLRLASKGKPYYAVVTKLALEKAKNDTGIAYAKIVAAPVRELAPNEVAAIRAYASGIRPALDRVRADNGQSHE